MNTFYKILYLALFIILAVFFVKFALLALVVIVILLWLRTWQMKKEPQQRLFANGKLPNPKPDGQYVGNMGFNVSWAGKKFDAQNSQGINLFKGKKGNQTEAYPFKTWAGRGLFDEHTFVLKIDYNVKGNPFWAKWVLDEIVEIIPGYYLGKMHLRIIPGFAFSVLYFELKKYL